MIKVRRVRAAVGVLLGVPCIVGRSIDIGPGPDFIHLGGHHGLVRGVRFGSGVHTINVSVELIGGRRGS